jgi:hypothetical protein
MPGDHARLTERTPQPQPTATVAPARPAPPAERILALQRSAGNQQVARLLSRDRPAAVMRDGPPAAPASGGAAVQANALAQAAHRTAPALRNRANMRLGWLATHNQAAESALGAWAPKREQMAERYRAAWGEHSRVMGTARAAVDRQNLITGVVVGAAASVVVAAAGAWLAPAAAAAAPFTGTWWAFNAATATASSVGGTAAALPLQADSSAFQAQGSANDDMADALRQMYAAERQARRMGSLAPGVGVFAANAEYATAQINALWTGGEADMTLDATLTMVSELMAQEHEADGLDRNLASATAGWRALAAAAAAWQVPTQAKLEQDIWIVWIAGVSDPDLLDRDAIEDHLKAIGVLGPGSRLGVDFGYWTSAADENAAVAAARGQRQQLEEQRRAAGRPGD